MDGRSWPPHDDRLIDVAALCVSLLSRTQAVSGMQKLAARRRVVAICHALNDEQTELLLVHLLQALSDFPQLARRLEVRQHAVEVGESGRRRLQEVLKRAPILAERGRVS